MSLSILSSLYHHASQAPDRDFVIDLTGPAGPRHVSYSKAVEEVGWLAQGLASQGVRPRDRVVLRLANSWEFVVVLLATLRLGAVAVPTIRQYTPNDLRHALEDSGARAIVFDDDDHDEVAKAVPNEVPLIALRPAAGSAATTLDALREDTGRGQPFPEPPPADDALIFYTSGTTSLPKGVVLTHRALLQSALSNAEGWRIRPEDRGYIVLPLFHCNAMFMQLLCLLVGGATTVITDRFSASGYLDEVRRHGTTLANLTAGAIRSVLAQPERDDDRTHSLRLLTFGLPLHEAEITETVRRLGVPAVMCYGLTESSAGGTRTPLHLAPRSGWQSAGVTQPGWDVAIADEDGSTLAAGELGEILLRGPGLMTRYWNRPNETAEALQEGWLRTGDLGQLDDDGRLFFHSRKKDMLKPRGENVAANEIEDVLAEHEAVVDAAVVGIPDPHQEERIIAYVAGATRADGPTDELLAFCASRLTAFKVPSEIVWVDDLPRTSIGKVNKGTLRNRYLG